MAGLKLFNRKEGQSGLTFLLSRGIANSLIHDTKNRVYLHFKRMQFKNNKIKTIFFSHLYKVLIKTYSDIEMVKNVMTTLFSKALNYTFKCPYKLVAYFLASNMQIA